MYLIKSTSLLLLLVVQLVCYSQSEVQLQLDHNNDQDNDAGEVNNTAIEEVNLWPNYDYEAQSDRSMNAYLDPTIIAPPSYGNLFSQTDLDNYEIDTGLEVGFTPGAHGVSPSGGATYTVPIQLPPGTNGMEPSLSIAYNSQGGDGLLGMGWNLAGLSVISRVGKTFYDDGFPASVKFDSSDNFSLDGQKLFVTEGVSGGVEAVYGAAIDNYSIIQTKEQYGNGPKWFKVLMKNGTTMEYGRTSDSRFNSGEKVLNWYLNKVYDPHGNYIEYRYIKSNNQIRIDKILYTGHFNPETGDIDVEPYNEIQFYYSERTDNNEQFISSFLLKSNFLLSSLKVKSRGSQFRRYIFNYGLYVKSYLKEIEEYGENDGTEINSTIFRYGEKNTTNSETGGGNLVNYFCDDPYKSIFKTIYGTTDFNNDGKADLILHRGCYHLTTGLITDESISILSYNDPTPGGVSSYSTLQFYIIPYGYGVHLQHVAFRTPKWSTLDFDGNGYQDILIYAASPLGDGTYLLNDLKVILFSEGEPLAVTLFTSEHLIRPSSSIQIGDFTGDGRQDVFLNSKDMNLGEYHSNIYSFDENSPSVAQQISVSAFSTHMNKIIDAETVQPMDYNGDGVTDLLAVFHGNNNIHNGARIYTITKSDNGYIDECIYQNLAGNFSGDDYFPTKWHKIQIGDFNGDGLSDILSSGDHGFTWHVNYARNAPIGETGFTSRIFLNTLAETSVPIPAIPQLKPVIGDFNGDGRDDVFIANIGEGKIFLSRGFEFVEVNNSYDPVYGDLNGGYPGDFNGDGNMDILSPNLTGSTQATFTIEHFFNGNKSRFLHQARNAFNNISFSYDNLTNPEIYTKGAGSQFPVLDLNSPLFVLTSEFTTAGGEVISENEYNYGAARFHRQGKGFLGFMQLEKKDILFGNTTNEWSYLDIDIESELDYPTYLLKKHDNLLSRAPYESLESFVDYEIEMMPNGQIRHTVDKIESIDNELGVHVIKSFDYDENGNQTYAETLLMDDAVELEFTKVTHSGFQAIVGGFLPNLPTTIVTEIGRLGHAPLIESTLINYTQDESGLVESITSHEGTRAEKKVEFTYANNTFGLITTRSISGVIPNEDGTTSPITAIITDLNTYSDDGRDLIEHADKYGNTTKYTYHSRWGAPKTITDHLDRQNYFQYDGFGKMETKVDYLGNVTNIVRQLENSDPQLTTHDSQSDILYTITTNHSNGRYRKEFYNSKSEARFSEWTGQFYDFKDIAIYGTQSEWRNLPFFEGDANLGTYSVGYDKLGRVTEVIELPVLNEISFEPNEPGVLSSSQSNVSGVRSSQSDKTGRIIERNDFGGKLEYVYQSGGLLKEVKLNEVKIVENTYDEFGRQATLWDNNANTATNKNEYVYDSFDRLIKQTNARLFSTTNEYSDLGQLESKSVKENGQLIGVYAYDYYDSGNEKHQLERETAPSGCYTEYEYDDELNTTKVIEFIDGEEFVTSFEYDDQNKLMRKIYPSGFAVKYVYDSKEYLEKVVSHNGQIVLWEAVDGNAQGNLKEYHLNNGEYVVTNAFDDDFYLSNTNVDYGNAPLLAYEYSFDPITGNLLSRNLGNQWEYFAYDEDGLNRLIGVGEAPDEFNEMFTYEDNGNISQKGNLGPYGYHVNRKNAVVQVEGSPEGNNLTILQEVVYNHFNSATLVASLDESAHVEFIYGPDNQRRKAEYFSTDEQGNQQWEKSRVYAGGYERQEADDGNGGITELEVHYISAGGMLVAMYVIENGETEGEYYYPHTDHLGSIIHLTDAYGNIEHTQGFDAWGKTRNPNDLTYDNIPTAPEWLWRGYTGHEHLDEFGLINMNGRLYDPVVGRMLSPDNYVQSPDFSQSYNRYSYVWNNPLKYTDPSGELVWFIPNISWSSQGGWSVGGSVTVGVQGGVSAQFGGGYNSAGNEGYGYAGVTFAANTLYTSYSSTSGWSVGYTFGMSNYAGFNYSTNFGTVGVNYNITNKSWSGNISSWYVGQDGWSFNPSFSVMVFPEHSTNFVRGKGFRSHDKVLSRFVAANNQQGALDYFGFDGTYVAADGQSSTFRNKETGETGIKYRNSAFESYDALLSANVKESYHLKRLNEGGWELADTDIFEAAIWPEERNGVMHQYKNNGLYSGDKQSMYLKMIRNTEMAIDRYQGLYNSPYNYVPFQQKWWHGIYRIPRKW